MYKKIVIDFKTIEYFNYDVRFEVNCTHDANNIRATEYIFYCTSEDMFERVRNTIHNALVCNSSVDYANNDIILHTDEFIKNTVRLIVCGDEEVYIKFN